MSLKELNNIYFTGIGGNGMIPLALHCKTIGLNVRGSDMSEDRFTYLLENGITPKLGHDGDIGNSDLLVYSAAVKDDNPDLIAAKEMGIPTMKRAQFLGEFTKNSFSIVVAGSHGKSTTSVMLSDLLNLSGFSSITGACSSSQNSYYYRGSYDKLIVEGDEYDRSFLNFHPNNLIVLNIDNDHMDIYGNIENLKNSFLSLIDKLPEDGILFYNLDDEGIVSIVDRVKSRKIGFSLKNLGNNRMVNCKQLEDGVSFDLVIDGNLYRKFKAFTFGKYNYSNLLAAIVCSYYNGLSIDEIRERLLLYKGLKRRFELVLDGVYRFIDDYAHHPTEIVSLLDNFKDRKGDLVVVFQPHLYSRTREHYGEFAKSFKNCDKIFLAPIYGAREVSDGTKSSIIYDAMESDIKKKCIVFNSLDSIKEKLKDILKPGDTLLTVGAGVAFKVAEDLKEDLSKV
ncbi:MAG: UDP-N-acetylmuramate--L-alanine ligase [Candidatus Cloacimonadota bacterium]|nr:MAG: UDP-N-acetylmuramate--L-alanine ligase [Candidatus Cloacimonadota bacterium]PIE77521.1 MAG: UDP-N-acetylmuramate--L-alanine ligase [Candidatus Delongbacteria bacterium]